MALTDVVTLQDVKAHLRMPQTDTTDDMALMGFIAAVDDVISMECDDILPHHYDEYYDGGGYWLYLRHRPVLSIENVEEGWGWWNYELDFQPVNTVPASSLFAYSLDAAEIGGITRRSAGNVQIPFVQGTKNIRVQYTAGRREIPPSIRLAALEIVAHWYTNSQLRSLANSQSYGTYDGLNEDWTRATGITSINAGLPFRVIELLKRYRRVPIIG